MSLEFPALTTSNIGSLQRDRIRSMLSKGAAAKPSAHNLTVPSLSETEPSGSESETSSRARSPNLDRRRSFDSTPFRRHFWSKEPSPARASSHAAAAAEPSPPESESAYVKRLLTDVPAPPVRAPHGLRIAHPHGPSSAVTLVSNEKKKTNEQEFTGLWQCLRTFTRVETLEGDNAFQCRRCWKKAHADVVRRKGGRRGTVTLESVVSTTSVEPTTAGSEASMSDTPATPRTSEPSSPASASPVLSPSAPSQPPPPRASRYLLRRAQKRYLLAKLPPVLIVHLKRFQQTSKSSLFGGSFNDLKKLDEYVSFPERLDLSPFMAPEVTADRTKRRGRRGRVDEDVSHTSQDVPVEHDYHLYAVIVHLGGMEGGHYVAYVKEEGSEGEPDSGCWTYCSDEKTRPATWEEVRVSKAYLLWYAREPSES
jgi:hypothetical protein